MMSIFLHLSYEEVILMRKVSSTAAQMNGAAAPKVVNLTDRIRSQRDRTRVNAAPVWEAPQEGPGAHDVAALARVISTYAPHDGRFPLPIPGVYAIRASRPYTELVHTSWQPGLCIVAQGAKRHKR
jgi:hypothetical protein